MLYRDCDTAIFTRDGSGQGHWELRECPLCRSEELRRQEERADFGSSVEPEQLGLIEEGEEEAITSADYNDF